MNNQQNKLLTTQNTVLWLLLLINLILVLCALYLLFRDEKTDTDTVEQSRRTTRQQPADGITQADSTIQATQPNPVRKQKTGTGVQSKTELTTHNKQASLAVSNQKAVPEHTSSTTDNSVSSLSSTTLQQDQNLKSQQNTAASSQSNSSQTTVTETEKDLTSSTIDNAQATQINKTVTRQNPQNNITSAPDDEQTAKSDNQSLTVTKGDNLWDIAEDIYGSGFEYPRIFNANPDLNNPDIIEIGTVLQIPLKSDRPAQ